MNLSRQHHPHHRRRLRHRPRPCGSAARARQPGRHRRPPQAGAGRNHRRQPRHEVAPARHRESRRHPLLCGPGRGGVPGAERAHQQRRHHAPREAARPAGRSGRRRGHRRHQSARPHPADGGAAAPAPKAAPLGHHERLLRPGLSSPGPHAHLLRHQGRHSLHTASRSATSSAPQPPRFWS